MGTDGAGLLRIRIDSTGEHLAFSVNQFRHLESDSGSLSSNTIFSLQTDLRNNLWIGTESGLCMLNEKQLLSPPAGLQFERVRICEKNNCRFRKERVNEIINHGSQLWIGTLGQNIYCLDYSNPPNPQGKITKTPDKPDVPHSEPVCTN